MLETKTVNVLPVKTWHFLNVNEAKFSFDSESACKLETEEIIANTEVNSKFSVVSDAEYTEKVVNIKAEKDSSVCIINSFDNAKNVLFTTNIEVSEGAVVKVIELPFVNEGFSSRNVINGKVNGNGRIEIVEVLLGKGDIYTDIKIDLLGDESSLKIDLGYIGVNERNVDINIVSNHFGKKTECEINANGTLMDSAKKTFRGTIDFKNGCSDSVGNELENVLLLGENIVNKTVPLILCAEENVVGNHGATIGELDEDTLFYFESRGIDAETAKDIMSKASIEAMYKFIADEESVEKIKTQVLEILK